MLQNRGGEQKLLQCCRLQREDFLGEKVQHEAMAASEGGEKARDMRRGSPTQRERSEPQSYDPALRVAFECNKVFWSRCSSATRGLTPAARHTCERFRFYFLL